MDKDQSRFQFLKADWLDLIMANYAVDPISIKEYVPAGTELDFHEGICYISLVAFMFKNTKILGLKIPYHINFEEVNLRFYVKPINNPEERSVAFIKEIVPSKIIPIVANGFFKENYISLPMSHLINSEEVHYYWGENNKNSFSVKHGVKPDIPVAGSIEEFITEHYFGFTKNGDSTIKYYVTHPQWKVSVAEDYEIKVDFPKVYGDDFSFLNKMKPVNVCYAVGSEVSVSFPSKLL